MRCFSRNQSRFSLSRFLRSAGSVLKGRSKTKADSNADGSEFFETLEPRVFLSVTASFSAARGVLSVVGDATDNVINISRTDTGAIVVNTNYVFPIYETFDARLREHVPVLRGVVFFDQGTLVSEFKELSEDTWRMSAGVGLRLRIPVPIFSAPLEVYYGVALNRARDDEREGFTLSLTTRF